jgi:tRNA pseudouridine32 synthase/23S rRNA pseudouridine746 synthase
LPVLGEYRGLVFVDKPAGLQTESDARTADTLVSRLAAQLGLPLSRLHALSRLDTGVSGVVTIGLAPDARRTVQTWREQGRFKRRYFALASGRPSAPSGVWSESIGRASGSLRVVAGRNAEAARTDYALVASSKSSQLSTPSCACLLALAPQTGRTHQLRVHCAAHALPLLGDRAYGGASRLIFGSGSVCALDRIALHAAWVELPLAQPLRVESPTPAWLRDVWRDFDGAEAAFASARSLPLGA